MDPAKIGIYSIDRSSLKVDEIKCPLYTPSFVCESFIDLAPRAMDGN